MASRELEGAPEPTAWEPRPLHWESLGLDLRAHVFGDEAAPTLIIHHGFLDSGRSFFEVARALSTQFRVVCLDARGHGDSAWIPAGCTYSFADYVLDLHQLCAELDRARFGLVGHSMGGAVTSYFAGAFPERVFGLALLEGLGPPRQAFEDAPRHTRAFVETTLAAATRRVETTPMASVTVAAEKLRRLDRRLSEAAALTAARGGTRAVRGGVVWKWDPLHRARLGTPYVLELAQAHWDQVACPTLVLQGAESRLVPKDTPERVSRLRAARVVEIARAGHNLHLHEPAAVAAKLSTFFGGLRAHDG